MACCGIVSFDRAEFVGAKANFRAADWSVPPSPDGLGCPVSWTTVQHSAERSGNFAFTVRLFFLCVGIPL
jgi:hypothetical protein